MGDHGSGTQTGSGGSGTSPGKGGTSGTFSGIDPKKLPGTISSLQHDANRLHDAAAGFLTRFAQHGIDTQPLSRLVTIAHWASDQLPGLRRRQHLAAALSEYTPNTTMFFVPDNMITPGAAAKSAKDGKALAKRCEQQIQDHGGTVPEDLFTDLAAHSKDGDFLNAFYSELGPKRLSELSSSMAADSNGSSSNYSQLVYDRDLISRTFGAYTRIAAEGKTSKQKQDFWKGWFDRFNHPGHNFRPDLLMPFVDSGTYDTDFLVALGDRTFTTDRSKAVDDRMPGAGFSDPWSADHYVQYFEALSKDPEAAGEFMALRPDIIENGLYRGGGNTTADRTDAFVLAVRAGTIDLRATDTALSDRNTAWLIASNASHDASDDSELHPLPAVSQLYSEIIAQHWDDLEYAITSPAHDGFWSGNSWDPKKYAEGQDPARKGIEIQPGAWKSFMEAAIREPHAAASMSALFDASRKRLSNDAENAKVTKSDQDAVQFSSFKSGLLGNFYGTAFSDTEKALQDEADTWAEEMTSSRTALIGTAYALATGNFDSAVDMGKEKGQEYATGVLQGWIEDLVRATPDEAPKDLVDGIKGLQDARLNTDWTSTIGTHAGDLAETDENLRSIDPVTLQLPGEDKAHTYTGDPRGRGGGPKYITGPDTDFISVLRKYGSTEKAIAQMTPLQRDTYSRWVEDPAVVARLTGRGAFTTLLGSQTPSS
ncbi:hypothetical protein [Streptomyces sp. CA2R106]|uniref:hypothetical protein n=1 Tax=Streptomyces sp. CA2R106 TaxID=3120153 RepID=UPI0030098626